MRKTWTGRRGAIALAAGMAFFVFTGTAAADSYELVGTVISTGGASNSPISPPVDPFSNASNGSVVTIDFEFFRDAFGGVTAGSFLTGGLQGSYPLGNASITYVPTGSLTQTKLPLVNALISVTGGRVSITGTSQDNSLFLDVVFSGAAGLSNVPALGLGGYGEVDFQFSLVQVPYTASSYGYIEKVIDRNAGAGGVTEADLTADFGNLDTLIGNPTGSNGLAGMLSGLSTANLDVAVSTRASTSDVTTAQGVVTGAITSSQGVVTDAISNAQSAVANAITNSQSNVGNAITTSQGVVTGAITAARDVVTGAITAARDVVTGAITSAQTNVGSAITTSQGVVTSAIRAARDVITGAITTSQNNVTGAITTSQGVVTGAITTAQNNVTGAITTSQGVVTGAITTSQGVVTGAITNSQGVVTNAITASQTVVTNAITASQNADAAALATILAKDNLKIQIDIETALANGVPFTVVLGRDNIGLVQTIVGNFLTSVGVSLIDPAADKNQTAVNATNYYKAAVAALSAQPPSYKAGWTNLSQAYVTGEKLVQ
jgi:hypothetical protein